MKGSFAVSPNGEIPLYVPVKYPAAGAILAILGTEGVGELLRVADAAEPEGRWIKLPTPAGKADRLYREGFDADLEIQGAEFVKPATGQFLFGNPVAPLPLVLGLSGGGIESSVQMDGQDPVDLQSELQTGNKLAVTEVGLPLKIGPSLSGATGLLAGKISLSDISGGKPLARKLTFNGLYIPDLDNAAQSTIRGFFLLPKLPNAEGETLLNTPIHSGGVHMGR